MLIFKPQIMDVGGVSVFQMLKHISSTENQKEFAHNSDFMPESLGKVQQVHRAFFGKISAENFLPMILPAKTSACCLH